MIINLSCARHSHLPLLPLPLLHLLPLLPLFLLHLPLLLHPCEMYLYQDLLLSVLHQPRSQIDLIPLSLQLYLIVVLFFFDSMLHVYMLY